MKQQRLKEILEMYDPKVIVEIGTQRHGLSRTDDGQSTEIFAEWGDEVWSVDTDPLALEKAKEAVGEKVNFVQEDGVEFLKKFNKPINLLYLDGSNDPIETAQQYSVCIVQGVVVLDDCMKINDHPLGKGDVLLNQLSYYTFLECQKHYRMVMIPRHDIK